MQEETAFTTLSGTPAEPGRAAVLVLGATGGTGVRIVRQLLAKGKRVRVLVRNMPKAERELGQLPLAAGAVLEVAVADLSQPATVLPEFFEDVRRVISSTGTVVRPEEGDDADRSKSVPHPTAAIAAGHWRCVHSYAGAMRGSMHKNARGVNAPRANPSSPVVHCRKPARQCRHPGCRTHTQFSCTPRF